ncbi:MAG: ROK family protein [Quadrisphaera sp.]
MIPAAPPAPADRASGRFPRLDLRAGRPVVAVDVGGTLTKSALVDGSGEVLEVRSEPTVLRSATGLLDQLALAVAALAAAHPGAVPAAVGVHVPGLVDDARGTVLLAENLGLRDVPLRDQLAARTGLPVTLGNDARGAGTAEFRMGAARGARTAVVVSIGTGIGAAVFVDGRLHDGDGFGCELGHMPVLVPGRRAPVVCACGGPSCLEQWASAGGIARSYTRVTGTPVRGAREVFDAARAGDGEAARVVGDGLDALALAVAQLATVLAPEVVVIAGGLSRAGAELFDPLQERLEELLTFHRRPRLLPARFGDGAGVIASALRADELLEALSLPQQPGAPGGTA